MPDPVPNEITVTAYITINSSNGKVTVDRSSIDENTIIWWRTEDNPEGFHRNHPSWTEPDEALLEPFWPTLDNALDKAEEA